MKTLTYLLFILIAVLQTSCSAPTANWQKEVCPISDVLQTSCSAPTANTFYRHSWEYQHKGPDDGGLTAIIESGELSSNKVAEINAYVDQLESELPTHSQITLVGGGGCLGFCPYELYIAQINDQVLAKLVTEEEEDLYLTIPTSKYQNLWSWYLGHRDSLTETSYGKTFSTGDYGFTLTFEHKYPSGLSRRTYKLIVGGFENKQIEKLYALLMDLMDEKYRIRSIDIEALEKMLNEYQEARVKLANDLLEATPDLKAFEELFEIMDQQSQTNSMSYGLYFYNKPRPFGRCYEWEARFKPRNPMPMKCEARLTFPVQRSDNTITVGLHPDTIMRCLEEICETPFMQEIHSKNPQAEFHLSAAGNRLHTNSKDVKKFRSILSKNGLDPGPLKDWVGFYVYPEGSGGPWALIHHPANTDIFLLTYCTTEVTLWREQCQALGHNQNFGPPYPLLDKTGRVLQLLE